jgi:hypothetical protein
MASGTQIPDSDEGMATTLSTRRVTALPAGPGSIIHFPTPDLAVVANKPAGGGGGATIDVCKCTKTEYKCTSDGNGHTICKEQCIEWECTTLPALAF